MDETTAEILGRMSARAEKEPQPLDICGLCGQPVCFHACPNRVAELEQRLRIAGDPDGAEREALRARVKEYRKRLDDMHELLQSKDRQLLSLHDDMQRSEIPRLRMVATQWYLLVQGAQAKAFAAEARITELERILSAERAEYDWAVKGAKALEATLERVREWADEDHCPVLKCGPDILTILNGGTDGIENSD